MKTLLGLLIIVVTFSVMGAQGEWISGQVKEVYIERDGWTGNTYNVRIVLLDDNKNFIYNDLGSPNSSFIFRQAEIPWVKEIYAMILSAQSTGRKIFIKKGDTTMSPVQKATDAMSVQ